MLRSFLHRVANIRSGSDVEGTITSIERNVDLRGENLWFLVAAAMLASIGLDTNSTAVIIGAMLISPLMSPILGIGMALGRHDNELIRHALRNFAIAVMASLATSTLYFALTPLGGETSELLARTRPTILDVLVAFFGGIAGIVATSRRDRSTAIPGVAIATALMPPLCTAGFGIATARPEVALGAFYLFLLNAVFIALATFLVVKYLRFPIKHYLEPGVQKRYARLAFLSLIVLLIPSMFFLVSVYRDSRLTSALRAELLTRVETQGREVLSWRVESDSGSARVHLTYGGAAVSDSLFHAARQALANRGFADLDLRLHRVALTREEVADLSNIAVQRLAERLARERNDAAPDVPPDSILVFSLVREARVLYPAMREFSLARLLSDPPPPRPTWIVRVTWKGPARDERRRFTEWLQLHLAQDSLLLP